MEIIYVLPTIYTMKGKRVVMEYRTFNDILDRRTRFYKKNKDYIVKDIPKFNELLNDKNFGIARKDNRVILPNGETAFAFQSALKELLGE